MKNRLIYICRPYSSVFESQVVAYMKEIQARGIFNDSVLLVGVKNENDIDLSALRQKNLNIQTFKLYPNYRIYKTIQYLTLKKKLSNLIVDNCVLHLRTESLSKIVYPIVQKHKDLNVKVVSDIRGSVYEETLLYKKFNPVLFKLKLSTHKNNLKYLYKFTDFVSCVSNELKEYVLARTQVAANKVYVNHCLAADNFIYSDKVRNEYRSKLGIKEKEILFLFSTGGGGNWQNTSDIITKIADKGYKILNLSRQKIDKKNVINLFVPFEEVPKYLNAVDLAVVWRDDNIVNNVASPVKFSEYVCVGLPVIANNGVRLIENYIKETKYGQVIGGFDEIDDQLVENLISLDRKKISKEGFNKYSSRTIIDQYLSMYSDMLEN